MYANDLVSAIKHTHFKSRFSGIFACDTVPKNLKDGHFIIINRDSQSQRGSHWFCAVRLKNTIEIFDSLSVKQSDKSFLLRTFSFRGITEIVFNVTQVQPDYSTLCGQYCLVFLMERYHNLDMSYNELINQFLSDNVSENDKIVKQSMNDFYNHGYSN